MSTASRPVSSLPAPLKRLLYCAAAFALFLGVSASLNPGRSLAAARQESERATLVTRTQAATDNASQTGTKLRDAEDIRATLNTTRPLIGTLTGSPYYIWVYAGTKGPVYTVANKAGKILAVELSADELYTQLPDASVNDLQLIPTSATIMLVDPATQSIVPER